MGRPRHAAPGAALDRELAIAPDHLALADGHGRQAGDAHALEHVDVEAHVVGLGADRLAGARVPDHEIGIGADLDRTLARIDVVDLGGIARGRGDKLVHGQPPGRDARGPQHRHPVLNPAGAVRDHREVVDAHALLLELEAAVIGGDDLERARHQPVPERLLVVLRAERRAHHPAGGVVPVGALIDAVVERQMLDQRLAVDALAVLARPFDRVVRLPAGGVDHVERHADRRRDHDRPVGRLALDLGRP